MAFLGTQALQTYRSTLLTCVYRFLTFLHGHVCQKVLVKDASLSWVAAGRLAHMYHLPNWRNVPWWSIKDLTNTLSREAIITSGSFSIETEEGDNHMIH